ncbi:azurin [Alteromonas sp. C1M14]|uniref:azurin n=1 Tax=Alteromonas sp. C1M14 TaxID=2841567 RepID=UPI001C0A11DB|nr:azurin [Alteromonas sp. C1M14]MBU2978595.1 azurin [Alteromonas sp. C1M14]
MKTVLALITTFFCSVVFADDCATTIESADTMRFNKASIDVPAHCTSFTLTLNNTGTLAKNIMGHNWVLTKASDAKSVVKDGASQGLANNYLSPNDPRVIANTRITGGKESASVTFDVSKLTKEESYLYFCSFPGHMSMLKGSLRLI